MYEYFLHQHCYRPEDRPSFSEVCELMKGASDAGEAESPHPSDHGVIPTQGFLPPPPDLEEDVELNELLRLEEQLANTLPAIDADVPPVSVSASTTNETC